jgi:radical SAM enzyme (TIGR01210 family)
VQLNPIPNNPARSGAESYPATQQERNRWIVERRATRTSLDATKPYTFLVEFERSDAGQVVPVAAIFLTNRECPWRCLMCDLWKNTLPDQVPPGAIPAQVNFALGQMRAGPQAKALGWATQQPERKGVTSNRAVTLPQIKLYNNGSFFDPHAIPPDDYPAIVIQLRGFERVIVECHPALVKDRVRPFRDLLQSETGARLEVAMGLETAHPEVLEKLNKGMTLAQFRQAAAFLRQTGIALRVFILVQPPFLAEANALQWAQRSVDFAFDVGATAACLIPTRPGNGALEVLAARGLFAPPRIATLEAAVEYGIRLHRGRVFADLWSLGEFSDCPRCYAKRAERLERMNLTQEIQEPISCDVCGPGAAKN